MKTTRSSLDRKIVAGSVAALALTAGLNVLFRNPERGAYDVAKESLTTLSPKTTAFLAALSSPVKITYYVTEKKRMPTALGSMEREVRALLRQMTRWAPHSITVDIVHPEDQPQEVRGLGRFRLSSFQYKTILKDEYNVSTVWSGLLLEYKGVSRAIPYLTPDHLPHLENRIITHLHHIDTHYAPTVAVRSPKENRLLSSTLETLNMGQPTPWKPGECPPEADVAFLIQPEHLTPTEVESVDQFLKDGKDIYLFFSPYRSIETGDQVGVVPIKSGLEDFLAKRGVTIEPKLLMGPKSGTGRPNDLLLSSSLANLEGFVLTAQGTLLFPQAAPIVFDPVKGKAAGFFSRTLLISDEKSWTRPFRTEGGTLFSKTEIAAPPPGTPQSETIGLLVTSDKPWEGKLFIFSSGYLIDDAAAQMNKANGLYLKNLLMTFAKPELLTSIQASRKIKTAVPPQSRQARLFWRLWAMGMVPLVGLIGLFFQKSGDVLPPAVFRKPAQFKIYFLPVAGIFLATTLLTLLTHWNLPTWDATQKSEHTLSPLTLNKIGELTQNVKITFYHSSAENLPLTLKTMGRQTQDTLERLAAANRSRLSVRTVTVPDDPSVDLKKELARVWVAPFLERVIEQDRYVEKKIYSALVFETDTRAETIPRFTLQNLDRLEFLTVSALTRLQGGRRPTVGILVDLPRLTAAEFWELEQLNAKVMPKSEDVYARLIDLLRNEGYAVRLYDTKTETPGSEDVLLYLQPWLITPAVRETLGKRLHDGGKVLIAAQHYRMQARKYPGHAYALVYWPQPQFSRINEFLEPYGVELVKEVFLDQSKAPTAAKEQINWGAYRKEEMRAPDAQPFLIRAIPENFAKDSPITARLSDLLIIWGNRWRKIPGMFPPALQWKPLVSSSKDAWGIDWKGGFLSPDDLREGNYFDATQPLAVELTGPFPMDKGPARLSEGGSPGRLVLMGCSEIFSNENLDNAGYDNPKFLLNAVASLAYGPDLAWIQARGTTAGEGFPFVPPAQKIGWRLIVLALVPALLALLGWRRLSPASSSPI